MTTTPQREIAPRYDAAAVEPAIYERWMAAGAFRPADDAPPGLERFVITSRRRTSPVRSTSATR